MTANQRNTNAGKCVPFICKMCNLKTVALTTLGLILGTTLFAQRIVFPGQNLLAPQLNDPSYVGLENRVNIFGMLQVADFPRRQHTQYIFAQIPVSEKFSFGVDYFKDGLEVFTYSTAMINLAKKFQLGGGNSYVRLGVSGGIDSRRQSAFPAEEVRNMVPFVARLNEGDNSFTYRAGIHYRYNALSIGANYNRLPIQSTLARTGEEDLIGYWIIDGYTGDLRYSIYLKDNIRLTPIARYNNYAGDAIYEGALLVDVGSKFSASVSYKNDYSINPALQFRILDIFQVGYSYEKSFGDVNFEDIHSLSIAYNFSSDDDEEPEWRKTARNTNRKIAAINPKKEAKQREAAAEKAAKIKAAEKAAVQKEVAKKEAAQRKETEAKVAATRKAEQKAKELEAERIASGVVAKGTTIFATDGAIMKKGYYIIVGTYKTMEEARTAKQRFSEKEYFTAIGRKRGDDSVYLYIDYDTVNQEAEKRLRAHKLDPNFKSAYLLEVD